MDGIVTGEGVLLDSQAASVASRLLGALIDVAVLAVVVIVAALTTVGIVSSSGSSAAADVGTIVFLVVIMLVLPVTVDTLTRGRSLGKVVVGIRIVRDDGGPIVFRQAFVRALTGVVELWLTFGIVATICSMVHPQGKRVGDILAGTYAVRVRGATKARAPIVAPPHLTAWAQRAEVARLPDGLALTVRQFLHRAGQLHPASRVEIGSGLTAEVGRYVQPLPPVGTHPEDFLAAVLAERRRREVDAMSRAAARSADDARSLHRLPHGVPDPVD
ncbi:RDD family protein [Cellulomonas edaphi]|uniref:RDD family protein n=1 Tax=Cellulomonas edaphi TaxID=3053468 RepID=A0ABT7S7Y0_9CELL|nr:RDD family protein [Cellulomons edaphi]MDM7831736.1 RDD family protein [Cellulomons edaphi]